MEYKEATFDEWKDDAFVGRVNEILKLNTHQKLEHWRLFAEPLKLQQHFGVCNLYFKESEAIVRELQDRTQDFDVKKVLSSNSKIKFLNKQIMGYVSLRQRSRLNICV